MTVFENLARLCPLHLQRIVELTHERGTQAALAMPSRTRWLDLAGLFIFSGTPEGYRYWMALATGAGLR